MYLSLITSPQGSLLPVPINCLASMQRLLPELGADLFQGFMTEVQGALSKLQGQSSAVEDYVDKIEFLAKVRNKEVKAIHGI